MVLTGPTMCRPVYQFIKISCFLKKSEPSRLCCASQTSRFVRKSICLKNNLSAYVPVWDWITDKNVGFLSCSRFCVRSQEATIFNARPRIESFSMTCTHRSSLHVGVCLPFLAHVARFGRSCLWRWNDDDVAFRRIAFRPNRRRTNGRFAGAQHSATTSWSSIHPSTVCKAFVDYFEPSQDSPDSFATSAVAASPQSQCLCW